MSYKVYTQDDGAKKVILLEEDNGRAYVTSNTFSKVSEKSRGRFEEEGELLNSGFGISRWNEGTLEEKTTYDTEFSSLAQAIKYVKKHNSTERTDAPIVKGETILANNKKTTMNNNVLNKFELEAFFTKENIATAVSTRKSVRDKRANIERVIDTLTSVAGKLSRVEECIDSSFNSENVDLAQKSLEKAQKVIEAFEADENLSYQSDLGKTKLEAEVEAFDAKAFLKD